MATGQSKSTSPTRDALRILFRNPSAVLALVMILLLAATAVTGTLLTGPEPTPEQLESIAIAGELGDTLDLDVNTWSMQDPGKAALQDKLKAPFSSSEADDGKVYYMGTDHLGRDILAQLWAGSSISLTIGFLAVGISVLLGVSLGGIAGFFGREKVRLPLLASLLSALVGAVSFAAEAPRLGAVFLGTAVVLLGVQAAVALMGRRYRPVIAFGVALAVAASVLAYNGHVEGSTPEGKRLQHARNMAELSHDVLLLTRNLGHERRNLESGMPGAQTPEWLHRKQVELDIAYRRLALAEQRLNHNTWLTDIDIEERSANEAVERAAHLLAHVDHDLLKSTDAAGNQLRQRHQDRLKSATELEKDGKRRQARMALVRAALPEIDAAVEQALAKAESAIAIPEDFDFADNTAVLDLLRDTQQSLLNAAWAAEIARFAEKYAAAGGAMPLATATAATLADAKSKVEKLTRELHSAAADTTPRTAAKQAIEAQLALAKLELEVAEQSQFSDAFRQQLTTVAPDKKEALQRQLDEAAARVRHLAARADAYAIDAQTAALVADLARKLAEAPEVSEADKTEKHLLEAQLGEADAARAMVAAVKSAADAAGKLEVESLDLRPKLAKPADDADRMALFAYDYGIKGVAERNPLLPNDENSNLLLNRRAQMRANYLKQYESSAAALFDGPGGIVKVKQLDGSLRYGTYRITRHFLTFTVLAVLLLITALVMSGAAQSAATEMRGPLRSLFIPTLTVDDLVMRFTEIMMTIPVIFLILAVLALFERDVYIVMGVIGLTSWMGTTRFVRAEILSLREQDFVQAARALGVSDFRIIWRHLVPNAISPVLVSATIGVAGAVLAESTLSFLGIGAGPDQHTWGKILSNGRAYIADAPWMTWIPGMAILVTVLSFNLLGEGLREAFNPKLRGR